MADVKEEVKTWQQKLRDGEPLNPLEETKADADFNYKQRLREQRARDEFEARKSQGRPTAPLAPAPQPTNTEKEG